MNQVEVKRRQIETCAWVIGLINILVFGNVLGNKGITYFLIAMECFAFLWTIFAGCLSDTLGKMLRTRIGKGQYRNANTIRRRVFVLESILGIVCTILLLACAGSFAQEVFQVPHSTFIMLILAPALFLRTISAVLIGYFQGEGSELPAVVAAPLRQILLLGFGLLFSNMLGDYGTKVSNLLGDNAYTAMYSAVGVAIAFDLAEILVVLFLGLITMGNKHSILKRDNEGMRKTETLIGTIKILYGMMWLPLLLRLFELLPIWIGTIFYRKHVADVALFSENFGMFVGKYGVLCGIFVLLIMALVIPNISKAASAFRKEDYRGGKLFFQSGFHICMVHGLFFTVFVAIMAKQLAGALAGADGAMLEPLLKGGAVLILLLVLFFYFARLLLRMGRKYELLGCLGITDIVFIITLSISLNGEEGGLMSVVLAGIVGFLVGALAGGALCCKLLHSGIEWLQAIAIPVGAVSLAGLLSMFLGKILTPHLGNVVTAFVCLVLSFIVYWGILLMLRSFRDQELKYIFGGRIIRAAGQTLHVFDMD